MYWVTPSRLRNYLLNNKILDYFAAPEKIKPMSKETNKDNHSNHHGNHNFLMNQGIKFEECIMKRLAKKFASSVETIATHRPNNDVEYILLAEKTRKLMWNKVPLIYQAVLVDESIGVRGIPDLLARGSIIKKIWKKFPKSIRIVNDNYYVIDVKYSCISFCANGITIRNDKSFAAYKGQLYCYAHMLNTIQGGAIDYAFILGRQWKNEAKNARGHNAFDCPGVIDYTLFDKKFIGKTMCAIEWVRDVNTNKKNYTIIPESAEGAKRSESAEGAKESRIIIYPNMSCNYDSHYNAQKREIAIKNADITLLWNCGARERELAHKNGVYSFMDPHFSSSLVSIKGLRGIILDAIIEVNRNQEILMLPEKIRNKNLVIPSASEMFVCFDFETVNCDLAGAPSHKTNSHANFIFMIGIYWDGYYRSFKMKELNHAEELLIISEFFEFIKELSEYYCKKIKLVHWSCAEKVLLHKFLPITKNYLDFYELFDLRDLFLLEPIAIKGAFGYGLKEITNAMTKNGFIDITWPDDVANGFSAMIMAHNAYKKSDESIMNKIEIYNKIDTQSLWEIIKFLQKRTSH